MIEIVAGIVCFGAALYMIYGVVESERLLEKLACAAGALFLIYLTCRVFLGA